MTPRRAVRTVGTILLALPALLGLLLLINVFSTFGFITRFDIVNASGQPIWITPLGVPESGGPRQRLPQKMLPHLDIPALHDTDLLLPPNGTIAIYYDWDDINFTDILVRDAQGQDRVLVIDANPPTGKSFEPKSTRYSIPPLQQLSVATYPNVRQPRTRMWAVYGVATCSLIALLALWVITRDRSQREPATKSLGSGTRAARL